MVPRSWKTLSLYCMLMDAILHGNGQTRDSHYIECVRNGLLSNEGFNRSVAYVRAWMAYADPSTGLIPKNIRESSDFWNAWDAAADNYPFMVLTSSVLMPDFFRDTAAKMLRMEKRLTSRIGRLPDTYSFSSRGFRNARPDSGQILFGAAEYMKDGLVPLTEWLGKSAWSRRMLGILEDVPRIGRMATNIKGEWFGNSIIEETNGDLLQVLSRMYWFTGRRRYLDWAVDIADTYLNEKGLPTRSLDRLRLRDHGCEIVSGLCEAYLAAAFAWPEKREKWRPYIHEMLDRILEAGRNGDGLFYDEFNPLSGKVLKERIADNFGYTLNAYWFVYLLDRKPEYRDAVIKALSSLNQRYRGHDWESGSADGYADAIEGALNLFNRERLQSVQEWLDSEIKVLWRFQKPEGMVEGWHGDGNFARTNMMYCLWKTQGVTADRWDPQLHLGASETEDGIRLLLSHPSGWKGKLLFDTKRHRDKLHMPFDYPRINQFPEWLTIEPKLSYLVTDIGSGTIRSYKGRQLASGLRTSVEGGKDLYLAIRRK